MFNLVSRNLTISVLKTTSIHGVFARSLSSSPAASNPDSVKFSKIQHSFTVSYLIESCGFPPEKAISASKYLNFKTPDRADSVIAFFKNQGFTEPQIYHLVRKFPMALTCNPQTNLLPKFEFLSSIGLSDAEIVKLVTARPKSLGRSLKNHLKPTFKLLKDLLQSNDRTLIAIKRCAWVLDWDFQSNMVPNMEYLRDVGVPGSKMLYVLTYQPRDFLVSNEQFKMVVEEIVEMGFDPLKTNFMLAIHALSWWLKCSESTFIDRLRRYEKEAPGVLKFYLKKMDFAQ
ncbi:Mitochodrial transcription termination factor-related protein [Cynara cardunculus var. scolymus]|uniref:Mitochodrial transcription termination factor-related protein n=1 Tax=Cynara cardunculus var. scolymus TaxID=59895 RepID=A0A103YN03_CYNCS|nr:Mitochodrial transcription termination factor-related protein [Cynara cardunculus var. scolymus]